MLLGVLYVILKMVEKFFIADLNGHCCSGGHRHVALALGFKQVHLLQG